MIIDVTKINQVLPLELINQKLEVVEQIKLLTQEFKIKPPEIIVHKNTSTCANGKHIVIGLGIIHRWKTINMQDIVCHEFSHTVDFQTNPIRKNPNSKRGRRMFHDATFYEVLKKVSVAWYGNDDTFQWDKEYATLANIRRADKPNKEENAKGQL